MQVDLLPNLPPSGEYENVLTAIDVFSSYLFAYPLTDASAINVAKVLIDIMTKHSYLPTTLITDKGTAFTSAIIAEIKHILGITLKCATTKHPQTIGKLERTHASLKTNFKMACGEHHRQSGSSFLKSSAFVATRRFQSTLILTRIVHSASGRNIFWAS